MTESEQYQLTRDVDAARAALGTITGQLTKIAATLARARAIGTPAALIGSDALSDFKGALAKLRQVLGLVA